MRSRSLLIPRTGGGQVGECCAGLSALPWVGLEVGQGRGGMWEKKFFSGRLCLVLIQLGMASWELHRVVKAETGMLSPGYSSGLS